jgi:hypothetical protein
MSRRLIFQEVFKHYISAIKHYIPHCYKEFLLPLNANHRFTILHRKLFWVGRCLAHFPAQRIHSAKNE